MRLLLSSLTDICDQLLFQTNTFFTLRERDKLPLFQYFYEREALSSGSAKALPASTYMALRCILTADAGTPPLLSQGFQEQPGAEIRFTAWAFRLAFTRKADLNTSCPAVLSQFFDRHIQYQRSDLGCLYGGFTALSSVPSPP